MKYLVLIYVTALVLLISACGKDNRAPIQAAQPSQPAVQAALQLTDLFGRYYVSNFGGTTAVAAFIGTEGRTDQPMITFERFVGANPEEQCTATFNLVDNVATLVSTTCDATWPSVSATTPVTQVGHTVTLLGLTLELD